MKHMNLSEAKSITHLNEYQIRTGSVRKCKEWQPPKLCTTQQFDSEKLEFKYETHGCYDMHHNCKVYWDDDLNNYYLKYQYKNGKSGNKYRYLKIISFDY